MTKPVLFVTNHAPPFRVGAFRALHARQGVVFALIGGNVRHGGGGTTVEETMPFPVVRPSQRAVARLAASGRFRAVIAGMSGKVALPAAYAGARAGRIPFVLWATIWATRARRHRSPAIRCCATSTATPTRSPPTARTCPRTFAPNTQGPVFEAPQAVDGAFWGAAATPERHGDFQILFAGRPVPEKGFDVLERAADIGTLVTATDRAPTDLRNLYAGSDVVVVPSIPTRDFREPWGLVVNEAFHQGVPVIATHAVGAAAGGLVQHERTGLVVPAGDERGAASRPAPPPRRRALRATLGVNARRAVASYTPRGVGGRHVPGALRRAKGLLA